MYNQIYFGATRGHKLKKVKIWSQIKFLAYSNFLNGKFYDANSIDNNKNLAKNSFMLTNKPRVTLQI
jgi:hypothetical protein